MFTTDGQLLRRFLEGDAAAFERLFRRAAPRISRLGLRAGIPASKRDDFVQDVLLSVLTEARRFDDRRSFSAWVAGIAWRKALSERRRFLQRTLPTGALVPREVVPPFDQLEREELRAALVRSIQRLPPSYREVVELYYLEELPANEIARRLGRAPSTIRTQLARGLLRLRDLLPTGVTPVMLLMLRLRSGRGAPVAVRPGRSRFPRPSVAGLAAGVALVVGASIWVGSLGARPVASAPAVASAPEDARSRAPALVAGAPLARSLAVVPAATSAPASGPPAPAAEHVERSRLRLRFVDVRTRATIPGLVFTCEPWSAAEEARLPDPFAEVLRGRSDAAGEAVLEGVPHGKLRLRFSPADGSEVYDLSDDLELEVPVRAAGEVAGTVVDARGEPVEGAEVWTDDVVFGSFQRSFVADSSAADGSFRIAYAGGSPKKVWARVPGSSCSSVRVVTMAPPPVERVRLVLEPARASLLGRVLGPDGEPAAGALVTLQSTADEPARRAVFQQSTGADGRFSFDTLVLGAGVQLLAVAPDGSVARRFLGVSAEETSSEIALDHGARVQGRALDAGGGPLAHAVVAALPLAPRAERWELWRVAATDGDGRFRMDGVLAGPVELLLVDPGNASVLARETLEVGRGEALTWNPRHDPASQVAQADPLRRFLGWRRDPGETARGRFTPTPPDAVRDE